MSALEDAMAEIERAERDVSESDVRTELQSIAVSIEEMLDAEGGERTDAETAFGDADFTGAAPSEDNLEELEGNLLKLVDSADRKDVRDALEAAQGHVAAYRIEAYGDE